MHISPGSWALVEVPIRAPALHKLASRRPACLLRSRANRVLLFSSVRSTCCLQGRVQRELLQFHSAGCAAACLLRSLWPCSPRRLEGCRQYLPCPADIADQASSDRSAEASAQGKQVNAHPPRAAPLCSGLHETGRLSCRRPARTHGAAMIACSVAVQAPRVQTADRCPQGGSKYRTAAGCSGRCERFVTSVASVAATASNSICVDRFICMRSHSLLYYVPVLPDLGVVPPGAEVVFTGVHHVGFLTEDLQRSLDFYEGVLGLKTNPERPDERLPYGGDARRPAGRSF